MTRPHSAGVSTVILMRLADVSLFSKIEMGS